MILLASYANALLCRPYGDIDCTASQIAKLDLLALSGKSDESTMSTESYRGD
jgi:hypothetical protein